MIVTILISLAAASVTMGLARWCFVEGRKAGVDYAQDTIYRNLERHIDKQLDWYNHANDLERIDWKVSDLNAWVGAIRKAQRITKEPII